MQVSKYCREILLSLYNRADQPELFCPACDTNNINCNLTALVYFLDIV